MDQGLVVYPIGGLGEIGKNCMALEEDGEIIVIDSGIGFPSEAHHGVDVIIPDFRYLVANVDRIKGLIITHGHEDHIGAVPYFVKAMPGVPIYSSPLTAGLIEHKLKDHGLKADITRIEFRTDYAVGHFSVRYIHVTHSLADCAGLAIKTKQGMVVHSGDFKIDLTPIDERRFDFYEFARLGEEGVTLLMADSTNIEKPGFSTSERSLRPELEDAIRDATGRTFIAMFASHLQRIQHVLELAHDLGKRVALAGTSLERYVGIARELGYLRIPPETLVSLDEIDAGFREHTVVLVTGTQAEPLATLNLLSQDRHRRVRLQAGDTVLVSANAIPGNEKGVARLINRLYERNITVIHKPLADVHTSGHAPQQDLRLLMSLVKPEYFIPVHGEFRFLVQHEVLAHSMGVSPDKTIVLSDGDRAILSKKHGLSYLDRLDQREVYVDGKGVGDIGDQVLRDRQFLSGDGFVVCVIEVATGVKGQTFDIEILSRGVMSMKDSVEYLDGLKEDVISELTAITDRKPWNGEPMQLVSKVKSLLKRTFEDEFNRRPVIMVHVADLDKLVSRDKPALRAAQ